MLRTKLARVGAAQLSRRYGKSVVCNSVAVLGETDDQFNERFQRPVNTLNYGGSRVVELHRVSSGNILTEGILGSLKARFHAMGPLPSIQSIIVSSASPEMFSNGLELKHIDDKEKREKYVDAVNAVSQSFQGLDKETIALYSGLVDASVFGVFAKAKFRLGTESTQFRLGDLLEGRLPLGGAIAHHLAHTIPAESGVALARYLGVSGRTLSSVDLHYLDLCTHIVTKDSGADSLCIALLHTLPDSDNIKAVQSTQIHRPAVEEMLDSMDIHMSWRDFVGAERLHELESLAAAATAAASTTSTTIAAAAGGATEDDEGRGDAGSGFWHHEHEFVPETRLINAAEERAMKELEKKARFGSEEVALGRRTRAALVKERNAIHALQEEQARWWAVTEPALEEGTINLLGHPLWRRGSLVTPQKLDTASCFDTPERLAMAEDLEDVLEEVVACFGHGTVAECRAAVEAVAAQGREGIKVGDVTLDHWSVRCLAAWNTIADKQLVEDWFSVTKQASRLTLPQFQTLEAELAAK